MVVGITRGGTNIDRMLRLGGGAVPTRQTLTRDGVERGRVEAWSSA